MEGWGRHVITPYIWSLRSSKYVWLDSYEVVFFAIIGSHQGPQASSQVWASFSSCSGCRCSVLIVCAGCKTGHYSSTCRPLRLFTGSWDCFFLNLRGNTLHCLIPFPRTKHCKAIGFKFTTCMWRLFLNFLGGYAGGLWGKTRVLSASEIFWWWCFRFCLDIGSRAF